MMFERSPERVAWLTLIAAQLVFLLVACGATLVGRWFLLQSDVHIQTEIKVGRGTVGLRNPDNTQEQAIRINRGISERQILTTDEIAQGYLEFVDTRYDDRIIASALILPGSQVQLTEATRPRFSFADRDYRIELGAFQGRLEISIPPDLPRDLTLMVQTQHGTIQMQHSGLYLLWSLPDSLTVIPRGGGVAQIHPAAGQERVSIQSGQTGTLNVTASTLRIANSTLELVPNPLFLENTSGALPDNWACYSEAPNQIRGTQSYYTIEGRRGLQFHRQGENLGPGETGCLQYLGEADQGIDVSGYATLRLRATFNIRWHSLSVCGVQASECALMVELTYLNEQGQRQRWIHGFYAFDDGVSSVPRACNSCLIEHDRITPGAWYTYESGNLFQLPATYRPAKLLQVRFYASGHEYETLVGEVSLLAEP